MSMEKRIKKNKIAEFVKQRASRVYPPGFQGFSVYEIAHSIFKNIQEKRFSERAAAISFNFLMAIPPTLIVLFSLVPFLPLDNVEQILLQSIRTVSPNDRLYESVARVVSDFMNTKRREILSFGILFTLFYSSNGMMGLIRAFDHRITEIHVWRTGLSRRWKAIKLTLMLVSFTLISLGILVIQSRALDEWIWQLTGNTTIVKIIGWLVLVMILYFSICIIYTYGPSLNKKIKFFSPGSFLATLLFIAVSYGFFFIASNFVNYNKVYGSIGTLMMFMIWMFIAAMVILVGYEINLAIMLKKYLNEKDKVAVD
jgi:membrane protein